MADTVFKFVSLYDPEEAPQRPRPDPRQPDRPPAVEATAFALARLFRSAALDTSPGATEAIALRVAAETLFGSTDYFRRDPAFSALIENRQALDDSLAQARMTESPDWAATVLEPMAPVFDGSVPAAIAASDLHDALRATVWKSYIALIILGGNRANDRAQAKFWIQILHFISHVGEGGVPIDPKNIQVIVPGVISVNTGNRFSNGVATQLQTTQPTDAADQSSNLRASIRALKSLRIRLERHAASPRGVQNSASEPTGTVAFGGVIEGPTETPPGPALARDVALEKYDISLIEKEGIQADGLSVEQLSEVIGRRLNRLHGQLLGVDRRTVLSLRDGVLTRRRLRRNGRGG